MKSIEKYLPVYLIIFLFISCSHFEGLKLNKKEHLTKDEAYELVEQAERTYANGVIHNMNQEWRKAQKSFEKSLQILSTINIDTKEHQELKARIDRLLHEIAYDYQETLVSLKNFKGENAPAVLSLALEREEFSPSTRRQLDKLVKELDSTPKNKYDIPIVWNKKVKEKIVFFQNECHEAFNKWLSNSMRYLPLIQRVLKKKNLPEDLKYLPLVESGFNPEAYSWADAVGIWQFIEGTGKLFGLEINWWRDERRNPQKSTIAAANYLKKLYQKFGDWELALAGYNCGEGRVERSIKRQGTDDFWKLDLPTQTENYVPLFMAAVVIAKNPQKYGFNPSYKGPIKTEKVSVEKATDLHLVAQCLDTTFEYIERINPELLRWCTPPKLNNYKIKVPLGTAEKFKTEYAKIPDSEKNGWIKHEVEKGQTLSEIALNYNTSTQAIVDANSIRNVDKLNLGQKLLIPIKGIKKKGGSRYTSKGGNSSVTAEQGADGVHKVKDGETLSEISDEYNVSLERLVKANDFDKENYIHPGDKINIPGGGTKVIKYTVKSGDTPAEIAERHSVALQSLFEWNDMNKKSRIYPGDELTIKKEAGSTTETKEKVNYKVKKGDNLWQIARKFDASIEDIVRWNDLPSKEIVLSVGDELKILTNTSQGGGSEQNKITYEVKKGDSFYEVAQKFDVEIEQLKEWNSKSNNVLSIGEELVIYSDQEKDENEKYIHKVKSGDTLWAIAKKYDTTPSQILKYNSSIDPNNLEVGKKLEVYKE